MDLNAVMRGNPREISKVILGEKQISITEFIAVTNYEAIVEFDETYKQKVEQSNQTLKNALKSSQKIYGVNTGLGDNWTKEIDYKQQANLQKNILRSHSVAVGNPLSYAETRAIMLMALVNLGRGFSGVSLETLISVKEMLNRHIYPFAPGEGSVGYLSIEAHIYRAMIGDGKVFVDSKIIDSQIELTRLKIKIPQLQPKEGLALISGTMAVTGIAILATYNIYSELKNVELGAALSFEGLKGAFSELDENVMELKKHQEQYEVAANIRRILKGSQNLLESQDLRVQDALSIRTMPQMIGALDRVFKETLQSVYEELLSVSDNPVLLNSNGAKAWMNGNFDATYVSLHMDYLVIAVTNFVNTIERIVNRFLDTRHSGFPPFLVSSPGANNGLMIVHYTLAGILNEMKLLTNPVNINNSTMSAEQEDVVTFAYLASKKALVVSEKFKEVMAIWFFVTKEALEFLDIKKLAPSLQSVISEMRKTVPKIEHDRAFYDDLVNIKKLLNQGILIDRVEEIVGSVGVDLNV